MARVVIDTTDPMAAQQMYKIMSGLSVQNPDMIQALTLAILQDKGLLKQFQKGLGHIPVSSPQKGWEKLMYTPFRFNKIKDPKTGKYRQMTDQEKREKIWHIINRDSWIGNAALGTGTALANIANAQSRALDNSAKISASDEQRARFGATPSDRAAAAASPLARARANIWQTLGAIINDALHKQTQDERASFLQALSDSMYNNMGMSGQYADARRKLFDQY